MSYSCLKWHNELHGKRASPLGNHALWQGRDDMYRGSDSTTEDLFRDFLPFGGKLSEETRWVKAGRIMPWSGLETLYQSGFSRNHGRPGKEARKTIGHWFRS